MSAVLHGKGTWTQWPQPRLGVREPDIVRAFEPGHRVQSRSGDDDLRCLALVSAGSNGTYPFVSGAAAFAPSRSCTRAFRASSS